MQKKIQNVCSAMLPIDERLSIKRCRYCHDSIDIRSGKSKENKEVKRLCIVTGIHGDELEGQYVCYQLGNLINKHPEKLKGIVDIYPSLNPLGIDSITRGIPSFDLDMNRIFPGKEDGSMTEALASEIINSMIGADMVIDIHASNIFLREIPQARIHEKTSDFLLPYAKLLNLDFIWIHGASTVLEATLSYSLNNKKTPCIVVEMGVGMRITKEFCNQLIDGIVALLIDLEIWNDKNSLSIRNPIIGGNNVSFINADKSGIFVPEIEHWENIKKGDAIGRILSPLDSSILEKVVSPSDGMVFTLREYPVVYSGSLLARILGKDIAC